MEAVLNTLDERRNAIAGIAQAAASEAVRRKVDRMLGVMNGFNEEKLREFLGYSFDEQKEHLEYLEQLQEDNEKVRVCYLSSHLCYCTFG